MFHGLMTILMSAAQASGAAVVGVDGLPQIFAAACLDGEARINRNDVTKISFAELPSSLRRKLRKPMSGDVWRLNTSGQSYLYILNYKPGRATDPKICGMASERMSLKQAGDLLDARLAGGVYPERTPAAQWLRPEDGYVATATMAGKFTVVQVNWMSEEGRRAAIVELRDAPR